MHSPATFSCYVIGETSLAQQCGELLLERGHRIYGVISPNPAVLQWAVEKKIPSLPSLDACDSFLRQHEFDYLFSIVNNAVLPDKTLALPQKQAINFHDALLPRYGGIHATSWAIMNREKNHGITWHVMTSRIDAGPILKQQAIALQPDETALSLNIKCYQAARAAFAELIDELSSGTAVEKPQNLVTRSYFGRDRRPPAGCLISWDRSAEDIDAFVRALDFGHYSNPLGVPKIKIDGAFVIITRLALTRQQSSAAPGTILAITENDITVATSTTNVLITGLLSLDGHRLPITAAVTQYRLKPGYRISAPDAAAAQTLGDLYRQTCRSESFWIRRLADLQPLAIPDMRLAAIPDQSGRFKIFSRDIPETLLQPGMGDIPDSRPWQYLFTLFAAFLARHTGVPEFHLGLQTEALGKLFEQHAGFFATTLPVRCCVDLEKPLSALLPALLQELVMVCSHTTYPRDMLLRYPEIKSTAAVRLPIIVQQIASPATIECRPEADLMLTATDDGRRLQLSFATPAIDADYAQSIAEQFFAFVDAVAADPATQLNRIPLVSAEQRGKILHLRNDTQRDFNRGLCMHQLFEQQADCQPDAVATIAEGTSWTYRELNLRANRIGRFLRLQGVSPGMLVGICLERSHDMIAGLLGILKAGAAYVPLEPSNPHERIAAIVRKAGIGCILSQKKFEQLLSGTGARSIMLDAEPEALAAQDGEKNQPCQAKPTDTAYVIFTSGSTGTPKGVVVSHQPAINLFEWVYRICGFGPDDCVLFVTSLGFDLSVFDVFGVLGCGGKIHIASDSQRRDVAFLARTLCEQEITFWDSAPAALQLLVPHLKAQPRPVKNSRLRQVFLSGDWIPVSLPDDIREVFPQAQIMSLGGATEATVWSNYFPVNRVEPNWRSIPYGWPIQNSRYYILDSRNEVCPPGVTGDLYIAGDCLSTGYLNEPELTRQSFVPDPFSGSGGRMYRTGDLARYFPDGTIEFLGRSDFQVKVRGYRIELGEIEQVLRQHADIKEAVVAVRQDSAGVQKLVAYLMPRADRMPAPKELRTHAAQYLTDYMIPNLFVRQDRFPLSANGKVDRAQLPWPIAEQASRQPNARQKSASAGTSLTAILTEYFTEALKLSAISPDDDFFDLGVTSLNLIEIAEKLSARNGIHIPVEAFLDNASIRALTAYILEHCPEACRGIADGHIVRAEHAMPVSAMQTPAVPLPQAVIAAQGQPPADPAAGLLQKLQLAVSLETLMNPAALQELVTTLQQAFGNAATRAGAIPLLTGPTGIDRAVPKTMGPALQPTQVQTLPQEDGLIAELTGCFLAELGIGSISADADFFDLGVTSLNLIQIAEKLHERRKIAIPVEVFLDHTTIRDIAAYIKEKFPDQAAAYGQDEQHSAPMLPGAGTPVSAPARPGESHGTIELERVDFARSSYLQRCCIRTYAPVPVPLRAFSQMLALLKQEIVQGTPRYLYPSAGGLNAVQTYVVVKENAVEGVAKGIYYYHPVRHVLIAISEHQGLDREAFHPHNRPLFDAAAFGIFFIAQLAAIEPIYSMLSTALATLDTGYMGQLLMSRQAKYGLGLCPVAGVDFNRMHALFKLDASHRFIHCLLGGPVRNAQQAGAAALSLGEALRQGTASLTAHFSSPPPDRSDLAAVSGPRLEALNAMTDAEHEQLHRRMLHLRPAGAADKEIRLHPVAYLHNKFLLRATQRSYGRQMVPFTSFSRFLALLKQDSGTAKRLYPSAGGLYEVHTFVHVKPAAVEKIPPGIYCYNPLAHSLRWVGSGDRVDVRRAHFPGNRSYFNEAAFSLFLIARLESLQQFFGTESLHLAMLEAGYMGQLLMDRQAEFGLGVCPIGTMRFDAIAPAFQLSPDCRLAHSFLCGSVQRSVSLTGHECLKIER